MDNKETFEQQNARLRNEARLAADAREAAIKLRTAVYSPSSFACIGNGLYARVGKGKRNGR